jgi:ATP-dependent DNA ligase
MLDGRDLRNEPLHERRRLLHDLVGSADLPQLAFSREVPGTGAEVFAAADAMGLEGIVSKDVNSPYRSGTSLHWLKTKAFGEGEFHIIGLARDAKAFPIALLQYVGPWPRCPFSVRTDRARSGDRGWRVGP